jgi:putative transposase
VKSWKAATSWLVGRYVIMPDHIHLFCAPAETEARPLMQWVSYWKSLAAQKWPDAGATPIWQRHFWDTQLRRDESYEAKWQYVVENPVRHGLVISTVDWPYQGVLNELRW